MELCRGGGGADRGRESMLVENGLDGSVDELVDPWRGRGLDVPLPILDEMIDAHPGGGLPDHRPDVDHLGFAGRGPKSHHTAFPNGQFQPEGRSPGPGVEPVQRLDSRESWRTCVCLESWRRRKAPTPMNPKRYSCQSPPRRGGDRRIRKAAATSAITTKTTHQGNIGSLP
jgi:hypothetical protein